MTDARPASRLLWPDLMRVVAIFFVLVLHISEDVTSHWGRIPLFDWMSGNVYNALARFCVPVLFMVTGSLLLGRQEDLRTFFSKRLRKIAIPLIVWSFIYLLWSRDYANFTPFNAFKAMVKTILTGPAYYHLWFMYALIGIYLLIPILRAFVQSADETLVWYLIALWFFADPLLAYLERLVGFKFGLDLGFMLGYIGFVVMGYQMGRIRFSRKWVLAAAIGLFLATGYTVYATYRATLDAGRLFGWYYGYETINVTLMSACAFILLKALGEYLSVHASRFLVPAITSLSTASFGIYLVHIIVLAWLQTGALGFKVSVLSAPPLYMIPLMALAAFLISFVIVYFIQKIPLLREIVP